MPNAVKKFEVARVAIVLAAVCLSQPVQSIDLWSAYQAALEHDATFQSVKAASQAVREALPRVGAQLLPQLSVSGTRFANDTRSERTLLLAGRERTLTEHNPDYRSSALTLSLRQPLFRMANVAAYLQAQAKVDTADATEAVGRQDLVLNLAEAYFQVLATRDGLARVQAQKDALAAQMHAATRALQSGEGTRVEVDEARARHDFTVVQEIMAREQSVAALEQLQTLVNRPLDAVAVLSPERVQLLAPDPETLDEWLQLAESNSPDLRRLAAQVVVAEREVQIAQAGHLPTVDLVAQRSRTENDMVTAQNTIYDNTQVGVQVTIPLFSSGQIGAAIAEARQLLLKARYELEAARRQLRVRIRSHFQGVTEGIAEIRALEQALHSAEQAVRASRKGVQAGTRTTLDVLNAEEKRITVLRDLGLARYRYLSARIGLVVSAGGDVVSELRTINAWLEPGVR